MAQNVNLITEEFIDNVKIHPKDITNDMSTSILKVLKEKKEGICSNHGFIKKNSIKLCEVGPGKVELTSFHGYVNYTVKYSAEVCNPVKHDIVSAKVQNINNFGILCTSTVEDDGEDMPVLEIIVPKHSPAIVSAINLENVKIGDKVMVQIIGKKYQLYNKKISIIGRIVVDDATLKINLDKNQGSSINLSDSDDDALVEVEGDEISDNESDEEESEDDQTDEEETGDDDEDQEFDDILSENGSADPSDDGTEDDEHS
jgi:DNA-directed RNA polymerase subunit E'/Rpb7